MNASTHPAPRLGPDRRVLLVMVDHHLGNTVISLPVIQQIANHFDTPPDVIVAEPYVELCKRLSLGRVWGYPRRLKKRLTPAKAARAVCRLAGLLPRRYHAALDISSKPTTAWIVAASLAHQRVGIRGKCRTAIYTHRLPALNDPADEHAFDQYARMLQCIGQQRRPPRVPLKPTHAAQATIDAQLDQLGHDPARPLIVIHPGAGKARRLWPADRFARTADALIERYDASVCIIGAPTERELMHQVRNAMTHPQRAFTLSTSLIELLALYQRADVLISNESGPTHLAAATDLPIATIFGPTSEQRWRPLREHDVQIVRGAACAPECRGNHCVSERRCVLWITPEQMVAAAAAFIHRRQRSSQPHATSIGS